MLATQKPPNIIGVVLAAMIVIVTLVPVRAAHGGTGESSSAPFALDLGPRFGGLDAGTDGENGLPFALSTEPGFLRLEAGQGELAGASFSLALGPGYGRGLYPVAAFSSAFALDTRPLEIIFASFDRQQYTAGDVATLTVTVQSHYFAGLVNVAPVVQLRFGQPTALAPIATSLVVGGTNVISFQWTVPTVGGQHIVDLTITGSGDGHSTQGTFSNATVVNELTSATIQEAEQYILDCGTSLSASCSIWGTVSEIATDWIPFWGTNEAVQDLKGDACWVAYYEQSGRNKQAIAMGLLMALDGYSAGTSVWEDAACFVPPYYQCLVFKADDVILPIIRDGTRCISSIFDDLYSHQSGPNVRAAAMATDSLMGWLPDSVAAAAEASSHGLANLIVKSGSSLLRVMADSSFATTDSIGIHGVSVLQIGSSPIVCAAMRPGAGRSYNLEANPEDAVTLRVEATVRDTLRIVLFHRTNAGSVVKLVYGPALLQAGDTAVLHTAKDSTQFVFSVDRNGDGIADWLLHPGNTVTAVVTEEPIAAMLAAVRVVSIAPNPFRSLMRMSIQSSGASVPARLMVYDVAGRLAAEKQLGLLTTGEHIITWDGLGRRGQKVAAGVYFAQVVYPNGASVPRRIIILR